MGRHHPVVMEGLDEAVPFQQARGEIGEAFAADRLAVREQLVGHRQHFDRPVHPLAHRRHPLVGALGECERHIVVLEVADAHEQAEGSGQEGRRECQ